MFIDLGASARCVTFKARQGLFEFTYGIPPEKWWKMTDAEKEDTKAAYAQNQENDPAHKEAKERLKDYSNKLNKDGFVSFDPFR
jgi:DNA-binding transcriptional regulator GbsR (MarR family)